MPMLYDRLPFYEVSKFNPAILNSGDISKDGQYFKEAMNNTLRL
jgi:hypothetical protein